MSQDLMEERSVFLSTMRAGADERRLAVTVVGISVVLFALLVPFAKQPLAKIWAFIPIYESALIINDLITAVMLFGQYRILHARSLLVIACAYLFTASITVVHALSFPGLFSDAGLLGGGAQTTAWLYMFWHGGFPLFVIAYTWLRNRDPEMPVPAARSDKAILAGVTLVLATVAGFSLVATVGNDYLPAVIVNSRYTPTMIYVVSTVWTLSIVALVALWRRRPHTVLDLWLMVAMCAWLFDIALSAMLNGGRFDLGFYAGRVYGLLAASFVLFVLLLEHGMLYARLVESHENERRKTAALTAANSELEAFSYSVSHDLRAPLRAMDGFTRLLEENYASRLDAEGTRLLGVVRARSQLMGQLIDDLLAFSRLGRQPLRAERVQLDDLVANIVDDLRADIGARAVKINVGELGEARGDQPLLKQALSNLLSNAVKFTRNRTNAVIDIGRNVDAENENVFFIKDNGAGFDMRYVDKLFGVFQRLHSAKEFEGTGVGLAIVHRVVTRHGGRIWAESALGEGAAFFFTLPR